MLAALTLLPAAEVMVTTTPVLAAAWLNNEAGRACKPTLEATTTVRSDMVCTSCVSFEPYAAELVSGRIPVRARSELYVQRHAQLCGAGHARAHDLGQLTQLAGGHLEHQFVVHLQQHPRAQRARADVGVDPQHRALDDVGGRALDRRVERLTFGVLAQHA